MLRIINICAVTLLLVLLLNNESVLAEEQQVSITADVQSESVQWTISLTNTDSKPRTFEFASSKAYDISVMNEKGDKVYSSSSGKLFDQAVTQLTLQPGERKVWQEKWDYYADHQRVEGGMYKVEVILKDAEALKATAIMDIPEENPSFGTVSVFGKNGSYTVKGKVRAADGQFYYLVEDGHNELISEQKESVKKGKTVWSPFVLKIEVEEKELPKNGTLTLYLYEKSSTGQMYHQFPVVLQTFQ